MQKVTIPIIVLLLVVAGFFGYLYWANNRTISDLTVTKEKLNSQISQLESELDSSNTDLSKTKTNLEKVQSDLTKSQEDLTKSQEDLKTKQDTINKLQTDKTNLNKEITILEKVMCTARISASEINVTTNQGLIEPINRVVEIDHGFSSISTTFKTLWNDSKDAIFTIVSPDKTSVQVVVSWDTTTSRVNGIYNINQGCMYFSR